MSKLCIYHASCTDGFAAAVAVYLSPDWGSETVFVSAHYGSPPPDVTGLDVIIVDFSYPREVLEAMNASARSLVVLDHHKTAQADLDGLSYAIFDLERSGAMMAWEYLFPVTPAIIDFVQDRDLWRWALPESREVSAALFSYPHDFDLWVENLLNDKAIILLKNEGAAILRYQNQQVERAVNDWHNNKGFISLGGFTVPIANYTNIISETCGALAKDYPFAATYFDTNDKRIYSLRVHDDADNIDIDLSEIANLYGGGGHAKAAGFSTEIEMTMQIAEE